MRSTCARSTCRSSCRSWPSTSSARQRAPTPVPAPRCQTTSAARCRHEGRCGPMSVLTVGLSHRSATVALLERTAQDDDGVVKLLTELLAADHVEEALVLSTCNRLEVYADVTKFHGGVQEVTERVAARTG